MRCYRRGKEDFRSSGFQGDSVTFDKGMYPITNITEIMFLGCLTITYAVGDLERRRGLFRRR